MTTRTCRRCNKPIDPAWNNCAWCGLMLRDTRTPPAPQQPRDLLFLFDLYRFGWHNHLVAATALLDALEHAERVFSGSDDAQQQFDVTPTQIQKILRAKLFAEWVALCESFAALCLAITKRKTQSMLWTYLNTQPAEVVDFYQRILSFPTPPPLTKLLALPRPSVLKRAASAKPTVHVHGLGAVATVETIEQVIANYTLHSQNLHDTAAMYRHNDDATVRIYNRIKHVFPLIDGLGWTDPPLPADGIAFVLVDDDGAVGPLQMGAQDLAREIANIRTISELGAELILVCTILVQLDSQI